MGAFRNADSITMPRRSEPSEPKILVETNRGKDENTVNREDAIAMSPYADHFELRWSVPNDNGDPILYYLIKYCINDKVNGEWRDRDCTKESQRSVQYTSFELDHLHPDTVYKIELRAHNTIGDSWPATLRVKTARGIDPIIPMEKPAMSSSAIIGIVIASIVLILLVLDITCYFVNRMGVIALCCNARTKQAEDEDPKLGRDEREPLQHEEKPMSVEFDGRFTHSKSGEIIGKHSAV
ncbi:unnamed protein product [Psylliodes chrysocephalus]|uniref:Fibronectin type-III domain-containing protein n=1 Tax=Psylliodes chrysocephalus TaxID=3402493 RepID=A0A9P0D7D6_9CUCU|nr:unnamed protein product [Psylliodes chrysocephala]